MAEKSERLLSARWRGLLHEQVIAMQQISARLWPPFNQLYPVDISTFLIRMLPKDDELFKKPDKGVIGLLRNGVQFPSQFVMHIHDPKEIEAFFPLLADPVGGGEDGPPPRLDRDVLVAD